MSGRFEGFSSAAFDWLIGIGLDNSRDWFQAHRAVYDESVRAPFTALLERLAEEFGGTPKIFRPNRDVRFSADKSPYKTNVSGYLAGGTTYYLDLSADGLMAATGYYQMAKDQLGLYRAALATDDEALANGEALRTIVEALSARGAPVEGDALKVAPRGIESDHPNLDLLKRKSLTISATLPFEDLDDGERVLDHARTLWKAGEGLNAWLDAKVGPSTLAWSL